MNRNTPKSDSAGNQDAESLLASLASYLGHDFRTPIAHMQGLIQLAASDPAHVHEYLARIQTACLQLDRVTSMMRQYLKTIYGKQTGMPTEEHLHPVHDLLLDAINRQRTSSENKGLIWHIHGSTNQWQLPNVSAMLLLDTLITNATIHGQLQTEIDVTLTAESLYIRNSCLPCSTCPESLPFTPLQRYHTAGTAGELGAGLGLALAAHLASHLKLTLHAGFLSPVVFEASLKA